MRRRSGLSRTRRQQIAQESRRVCALAHVQGRTVDEVQDELLRMFPGELMAGEARMYACGWTISVVRDGLQALGAEEGLDLSGLQDADILRWLRGEVFPRESIARLCRLFRCDQAQLGWPARGIDQSITFTPSEPAAALVELRPTMVCADTPAPNLPADWPHWFAVALTRLVDLVEQAEGGPLQRLLHQEMLMFDAARPTPDEGHAFDSSRRQLLISLLTLPVALTGSVRLVGSSAAWVEEALARCAASVTAAYHLLKGSDFAVVEQHLPGYLLWLTTAGRTHGPHQVEAARLASQAYRVLAIVALHRRQLGLKDYYAQQALFYAEAAHDPHLQAAAHQSVIATALQYLNDPDRAADSLGRALALEPHLSPLMRSALHASTALKLAMERQPDAPVEHLQLAEDVYPTRPEEYPSLLYGGFTPANLLLYRGLTYLALARQYPDRRHQDRAWETFESAGRLAAQGAVEERVRIEIVNHQAATAIVMDDLERFATYLRTGVDGARRMRSSQRLHEALTVWRRGLATWPAERSVMALADLFPDPPELLSR